MEFTTQNLLWLLPVPPLLSFFLIVLFTNKDRALSHTIGVGAAVLSFVGAIVIFFREAFGGEALYELGKHPIRSYVNWLPTGDTAFKVGVQLDPLTAIMLFFVGFTVLAIFVYSIGYHNFGQPEGDHDAKGMPPHGATVEDEHGHKHAVLSIEPMYSRFFAFISLFAFGMYVLVVSDNLLTLFVGWEIMGLCSYLLIGFWFAKPSARAAAIKAFITTRIGDVFMLLGLAYLYTQAGSLSYAVIFSEEVLDHLAHSEGLLGMTPAALIGILLFIGTVGKSAQFPLHVWLPDAMEGPTPVSAMIHAATMVSAGVYMVIRIFPILEVGGHSGLTPLSIMAFIGGFTAIFAATIAVAQNDIKRVLAYSTISQLGFMVAALGIGAYVAATFHLMTHAFFKALLFLGSGSVIHGMEHGVMHTGNHDVDPQDMMNMGGLKDKMPITFWTFLIGGMALSGFPFITAGFWSKDEILADAFAHDHWIVFGTLAAAALLTAFYTMRQITLTFFGEPRTEEAKHAHETPWTMTYPLILLAFFAVTAGWAGIPEWLTGGAIKNWMHDVVYALPYEMAKEMKPLTAAESIVPMITSIVIALGGLWLGYTVYKNYKAGQTDPVKKLLGDGLHSLLEDKYRIDELYQGSFVRFADWISEKFTPAMDQGFIDGILHTISRVALSIGQNLRDKFEDPVVTGSVDSMADGVQWFGRSFRFLQTGRIQQYMTFGVVVLVLFAALIYFI
jgi:NADH-quinone oxidoreductase subunit L